MTAYHLPPPTRSEGTSSPVPEHTRAPASNPSLWPRARHYDALFRGEDEQFKHATVESEVIGLAKVLVFVIGDLTERVGGWWAVSGWPSGGPENNYALNVLSLSRDILIKAYLGSPFEIIIVG